jgi:YD repeat-containing protein
MLKRFKVMTGALVLAAIVLPGAAYQLAAAQEASPQATSSKAELKPQYLVVRGRVLARTDQTGTTWFSYQNGRLVSELRPDGVVGTYQYDSDKFIGVAYTDGKIINITRNADGSISGLSTNSKMRVKFVGKPSGKKAALAGFFTIQDGVSVILNPQRQSNGCTGGDGDEEGNCEIHVPGRRDTGDDDGGGWGDWGDGGGSWGGGGSTPSPYAGPISNPPGETPEQCKENVCKVTHGRFMQYCYIVGNTPGALLACIKKAYEYVDQCNQSCVTNDWSWLDWWLFYF